MSVGEVLLLIVLAPLAFGAGVALALGVFVVGYYAVISVFVIVREIVRDFWREWRAAK